MKEGRKLISFEIFDYKTNKTELNSLNKLNIEYINWAEEQLDLLYHSTIFEHNDNYDKNVRNYSNEFFEKVLNDQKNKSRFILIKDNEELVGMGGLNQLTPDIGEIKRMYIKEKYRNRGLGKELLDKLLELGSEMKFSLIKLDSVKFMDKAHKLYEKAGFEYTGPYQESEIPLDKQKNWVFMKKKIL